MIDQPGPAPEGRRFLLIDAIMLVAVAAVMLSAGRAVRWVAEWEVPKARYDSEMLMRMSGSLALIGLSVVLLPFVLARTADRRRLRRGAPGLFVHVVVVAVIGVLTAAWAAETAFSFGLAGVARIYSSPWPHFVIYSLASELPDDVAIAVCVSWLTLMLAGHWHPERAWDDRFGRFVGILWVAFYLGEPLLDLLS